MAIGAKKPLEPRVGTKLPALQPEGKKLEPGNVRTREVRGAPPQTRFTPGAAPQTPPGAAANETLEAAVSKRGRMTPLDPNSGLMGPAGDARRAELRAMPPEQRKVALSQMHPQERMLLLGGSALRADVHTTGAAFSPDWNDLPAPHTRGYSATMSAAMAVASKRVYEPLPSAGSKEVTPAVEDLVRAGFKIDYLGNDKTSTQGFVATRGEQVIVAFRGTEPGKLNDLLADANVLRVFDYGGTAHMGFHLALKEVWPDVEKALKEAQAALPPGKELSVNVTGHSLGAAIGTLAALRIEKEKLGAVDSVNTFGSPRVLDPVAAKKYDKQLGDRTFRHENSADLVTKIPLVAWQHVGQHLFFDHEGNQHTNPGLKLVMEEVHKSNKSGFSLGEHRGHEVEGLWRHGIDGYAKLKYVNQNVAVPPWNPKDKRLP